MIRVQILSGQNWQYVLLVSYCTVSMRLHGPQLYNEDYSNYLFSFSHPFVCDSSQPHGLQHTRPPCPSPSPDICPSSCPLNQWCHPAISSSDALFSICPQSFPASEIFPMSWLSTSDDQNTSASAAVLPKSIQGLSSLRLTGLISLVSKRPLGDLSSTTIRKYQSLAFCLLYGPALTTVHDHWEDHSLDYYGLLLSLLFNTLSKFVIAFLSRSNCLLISQLQSPSTVILQPKKRKSVTQYVQFSCSVMSDSLWSHGLQYARPPCPSQLPDLAQTQVHQVGNAIQPSHPQFITTSVSPFYLPWSNGGFPGGLAIKNLPAKLDTQEMLVQSLGWENPLEGHDNPLQYSCLDSSMDRLARWSTICWVIKNQTWLKWLSANVARCHNLSFLNI